ncbi:hypothetical protein GS966_20115 [Rhodococcus hoagii]|nr:hypothetical protein [Prescottella equi]NKZ92233.1 hypothetical protein [Prescottella equi]
MRFPLERSAPENDLGLDDNPQSSLMQRGYRLPDCVLPGCRAAFGDMLRPANSPPFTAHQIAVRDRTVEHAYAREGFV